MENAEKYTQPLGLDVGTSRIVAARNVEGKYRYQSELNAFLTLPYSRLTESLLQREGVFHEAKGQELVVAGNDAQKFAEVFHAETRRPMRNGVLNPDEPHAASVVRRIIARLAGTAAAEGQKAFFSVPAPVAGDRGTIEFHEASLRQILSELGYEPSPIEEGLAVIFGELERSNFTGLGISCGSGLCNICLAMLSVPVFSFSVPKAGDFIDTNAAAVTGEVSTRVRIHKEENFRLNGMGGDRLQNAITVYYRDVIDTLIDALRSQITASQRMPKLDQAIPVVLSGGTAMPPGFAEQFTTSLHASGLPLRISEVRLSPDALNSTARGALMAALC